MPAQITYSRKTAAAESRAPLRRAGKLACFRQHPQVPGHHHGLRFLKRLKSFSPGAVGRACPMVAPRATNITRIDHAGRLRFRSARDSLHYDVSTTHALALRLEERSAAVTRCVERRLTRPQNSPSIGLRREQLHGANKMWMLAGVLLSSRSVLILLAEFRKLLEPWNQPVRKIATPC